MDVAWVNNKPAKLKARLPEYFSGRNKDDTHWLMAMKAYFIMNEEIYHNPKHVVVVMLTKMSKGRGSNREYDPNGGKLGKLKETHRSPTS